VVSEPNLYPVAPALPGAASAHWDSGAAGESRPCISRAHGYRQNGTWWTPSPTRHGVFADAASGIAGMEKTRAADVGVIGASLVPEAVLAKRGLIEVNNTRVFFR